MNFTSIKKKCISKHDEQVECETGKTITFIIASKTIKHLEKNLRKEIQNYT